MSSKKDMRRPELAVPYVQATKKESDGDMSSTLATTLPMAAMFTRNKMIGWMAVMFALQNWLAESPEQRKKASQPGIISFGLAVMSCAVSYVQLFLPPAGGGVPIGGTGTEAPAAVPPS